MCKYIHTHTQRDKEKREIHKLYKRGKFSF